MSREPSSSSQRLGQARGGWNVPKADQPPAPPEPPKKKPPRIRVEPAKPNPRDYPTPRLKPPTKQFTEVAKHEMDLLHELRQMDPEVVEGAAARIRNQKARHKELDRHWSQMSIEERNRF